MNLLETPEALNEPIHFMFIKDGPTPRSPHQKQIIHT